MDLTRRNFVKVCGLGLAGAGTVALVGCGGDTEQPADDSAETGGDTGEVANNQKPVIFFNRQPSNSTTGELDMTTLNFNEVALCTPRLSSLSLLLELRTSTLLS